MQARQPDLSPDLYAFTVPSVQSSGVAPWRTPRGARPNIETGKEGRRGGMAFVNRRALSVPSLVGPEPYFVWRRRDAPAF